VSIVKGDVFVHLAAFYKSKALILYKNISVIQPFI